MSLLKIKNRPFLDKYFSRQITVCFSFDLKLLISLKFLQSRWCITVAHKIFTTEWSSQKPCSSVDFNYFMNFQASSVLLFLENLALVPLFKPGTVNLVGVTVTEVPAMDSDLCKSIGADEKYFQVFFS